jgi:hypothetical protein
MNLEELQTKWAAYDQKLDASLRLNTQVLAALELNKTRSALQRLKIILALDLAMNFVLIMLFGAFIADHISEMQFVIPAVVLDLGVIVLIASGVRQLLLAGSVDYSEPVTAIQKTLVRLRLHRTRRTLLTLLVATLFWTPLLIVGCKALLGLDAYAVLGSRYLLWNLLVGCAMIPLLLWLSRKYAARMERSPRLQALMNDLAGRNVAAAIKSLDNLREFGSVQET